MSWVQGKRVVITGASDGVGAELARRLAQAGAKLVLAARSKARLDQVADECRALGASAISVVTDVGEAAQCHALIDRAVGEFGGLDWLINNAGVSTHATLDEALDGELFEQVMRVNLMGSVWCTRAALPHLRQSRGQLVAVCSLAGRLGIAQRTAYCASKFAQDGFFSALRSELEPAGVTVTIAYPGLVASGFAEHSLNRHGVPAGVKVIKREAVMSVEDCAAQILAAARRRKPELVMTWVGRVALWLRLISPTLVDRLTRRTVAAAKHAPLPRAERSSANASRPQ